MDQTAPFEKSLEADIRQLATEIRNQQERPEMKDAAGQELVKEAIRAFPETRTRREVSTAAEVGGAAASSAADDSASPLPAYAQGAPAEVKLEIEYLVDVALKEGIGAALDKSQKSPAFVQDAFHDALAGRLYSELQKRGMVK